MIVLGLLTAFGPLSIDMYLPALPLLARDLDTSAAAVQLTLSLFVAGLAAGQALYGPVADRLGRRRPLLFGCALYALASVGCALAPSVGWLIGLRLFQALGGCAGVVLARSVVRDLFDPRGAARMFSLLMLVMGLAPITAPLIGGQLLLWFGWRAIFWLLAAFGGLCVLLVLLGLPESLPPARRVGAGLGQALGAYRRILVDRHFMGYALTGALIFAGMFAYISGSPFVFIERYGVSPQRYGWIFGTNALGLVVASQVNRWLLDRFSGGAILAAGLTAIAAAGLLLVLMAATGAGGLAGLLPPLFVCVAGYGIIAPNASAAALAPYANAAGSASALLGVVQFVVSGVAGALVSRLGDGTALPMAGVIAGCGLAALVVFWTLARRPGLHPASG